MIESTIIGFEAAWELDPVRLENKLWNAIDVFSKQPEKAIKYRTNVVQKTDKALKLLDKAE